MSTADTPRERLQENATEIASMLVIGLGLLALFANISYFWVIFVIGFAVIVPIVSMIFDDEDEDESEWWNDDWMSNWWGSNRNRSSNRDVESEREPRNDHASNRTTTTDTPLETLRHRYARGELTDAQFERKLERLLETETIEDAEDRQRARDLIRERN